MPPFYQPSPRTNGQVAQIARTFGVDWQHLVAQIISFTIVCAVLYKFAYKRISFWPNRGFNETPQSMSPLH